jgi:hypothetical protein
MIYSEQCTLQFAVNRTKPEALVLLQFALNRTKPEAVLILSLDKMETLFMQAYIGEKF